MQKEGEGKGVVQFGLASYQRKAESSEMDLGMILASVFKALAFETYSCLAHQQPAHYLRRIEPPMASADIRFQSLRILK